MATATAPKPPDQLPPATQVKPADGDYLSDRGWTEQANGAWMDMSPPPDVVDEHKIADADGRTTKIIHQVRCASPVAWGYPFREALTMERARDREPLPEHHAFLSRIGKTPEAEDPRARGDEWSIRDKWKNILRTIGTHGLKGSKFFETKEAAEEWISKQKQAKSGEATK